MTVSIRRQSQPCIYIDIEASAKLYQAAASGGIDTLASPIRHRGSRSRSLHFASLRDVVYQRGALCVDWS